MALSVEKELELTYEELKQGLTEALNQAKEKYGEDTLHNLRGIDNTRGQEDIPFYKVEIEGEPDQILFELRDTKGKPLAEYGTAYLLDTSGNMYRFSYTRAGDLLLDVGADLNTESEKPKKGSTSKLGGMAGNRSIYLSNSGNRSISNNNPITNEKGHPVKISRELKSK